MTWANIISTGRGKAEYRLAIEGCPVQLCTSPDAEQTSNGQTWVACLDRAGLSLEESVDIAHADVESRSFTATMVDRQGDSVLTQAFAWRPSTQTYLTADLPVASSALSVASATDIVAGAVIHIGTEAIYVVSTGPFVLSRGYWDTIDQKHFYGDSEELGRTAVYVSRPLSYEGRRAVLYAYGEGDPLTGVGTAIWRGVVLSEPRLAEDGGTWSVEIASPYELLKADMGGELDADVKPRGIYYNALNPLIIYVAEGTDGTRTSAVTNEQTINVPNGTGTAFFDDNYALVEHINSQIDITGWTCDAIEAVASDDDWWFIYRTDTTTATYPYVWARSAVDGTIGNFFGSTRGLFTDTDPPTPVSGSVSTSTTYRLIAFGDGGHTVPGLRSVPRGVHGGAIEPTSWMDDTPPDETTAPTTRMYLDGRVPVGTLSAVIVEWDGWTQTEAITAQNAAARWVEFRVRRGPSRDGTAYTAAALPTVKFRRTYDSDGSIADWRDVTVSNSPTYCNAAQMPLLTSNDLADWQTAVTNAAEGSAWKLHRGFYSHGSVKLDEFLAHHWRQLQVFPGLDSNAAIQLYPLRLAAQTETGSVTIGESAILVDDGFPTWERGAFGSINRITYRWGYDPVEDEHESSTELRDATAYAIRKAPRSLEVAPQSTDPSWLAVPDPVELVGDAMKVIGIFGRDYSIIRVGVSLAAWTARIGTSVALTCSTLPDVTTGTRGVSGIIGIVVGRRWDLDQGRGVLTIITGHDLLGGYAPSLYVSGYSGSGTAWTITIDETAPGTGPEMYASAGDWVNHWAAGYIGQLVEWDTASPTTLNFTVDSTPAAGATTLDITTASTWTPGASTWLLVFREGGAATDPQDDYVYLSAAATAEITQSTTLSSFQFGG